MLATDTVDGKVILRKELANRYKIPRTTTGGWSDRIAKGELIYQSAGRPERIDAEGKETVIAKFLALEEAMEAPDPQLKASIIASQIKATDDRKNQSNPTASLSNLTSIENELDIREVVADVTTSARMQACKDPRMSYTQAILTKVGTEGLDPHNIWNWDATQLTVGFNKKGKKFASCLVADRKYLPSRHDHLSGHERALRICSRGMRSLTATNFYYGAKSKRFLRLSSARAVKLSWLGCTWKGDILSESCRQ